jgi:HAD superfamily hydrolase (TIGR01509 family)
MIEAVIFDMDGLLVDSERLWHDSRTDLAKTYNEEWNAHDHSMVMGVNTEEWARYTAQRLGNRITIDQARDEIVKRMKAFYMQNVPALPGADQIIRSLYGKFPLGLASGSYIDLINIVLDKMDWRKFFSHIVSSDEVEHGKPDPDTYFEIARQMKIDPAHMVVFEDSTFGILAGKRAGARVIAVPNVMVSPPKDVLDLVDMVLKSLLDFKPEMISNW